MDITTLINQITIIAEYVAAGIVALLALDNAVDSIAKMFGNKEIDTLCGKFALFLNGILVKLNAIKPPVSPTVLPPTSSGTSTTVTPTGV